jgi:hypothetical protein
LARRFPRPAERAVRFLDKLLADDTQPRDIRMRCAELVLASYGLAPLAEERQPRHRGLKALIDARLELSAVDKEIGGRVRAEQAKQRKERKLQREIEKLLSETTQETK